MEKEVNLCRCHLLQHCFMGYGCVGKDFKIPTSKIDLGAITTPAPTKEPGK